MMLETIRKRQYAILAALIFLTGALVVRLVSLQFGVDVDYFARLAESEHTVPREVYPPRGAIYDRNGVLLATGRLEYEIGISPVFIIDREGTADQLADITGLPRDELLEKMSSPDTPYVLLMRPAPPEVGQELLAANLDGVTVQPIERRFYPHGNLAAQVVGFVGYDGSGYYGVEGFYDAELRGQASQGDESRIPFEAGRRLTPHTSMDMVLTIDSEIQYLAEQTLVEALGTTGAESGTILVMDPRTGEILAMASYPTFDPNAFYDAPDGSLGNPAVSDQFEPGSIFKVLTMAIALDLGVVAPDSTYVDNGVLEVGGRDIYNWDRASHGVTSMTDLLGKSLNVGAATLSVTTGPTRYYAGLESFGIGHLTGVDLQGEAPGQLREPGDPEWHDSDLATNSFGQGIAVTPLQMTVAVSAVANRGLVMQPHVVSQRTGEDGEMIAAQPSTVGRAISTETAISLSDMLAHAVVREASPALVPGYSIAGKTGTAEIPVPGGYDPEQTIATFVGFGPVDDPRFVVLIKLDRPKTSRWGSETAAPIFSQFVQRLVILMEIPPDDIRQNLAYGPQSSG
jgi:cell division protein FtsI/penicillin-binding protein 2